MSNYRNNLLKPRVRELFDPTNESHLKDYAHFIKHSNWKNGCNYLIEDPHHDIPATINAKIIEHFMFKYIKAIK